MRNNNKKYCPSNGTEGEYFMEKFCYQCIHDKFCHTADHNDKMCDLIANAMAFDVNDDRFPREWTYDESGEPTCTAWKKWDWGNDGDPDDPENPKAPVPEDPNQLCFPFEMDSIVETGSGYLHIETIAP